MKSMDGKSPACGGANEIMFLQQDFVQGDRRMFFLFIPLDTLLVFVTHSFVVEAAEQILRNNLMKIVFAGEFVQVVTLLSIFVASNL